ncbi:MAG: ROK family transcriptional regulator [Firmicutes bacterium]|nr:ROK family transcriptional regulator [Bacillota bacterium]
MEIRTTRELKQFNRFTILNEIIQNQPISRRDLTKNLDASHATVAIIVKELIEEGLVVETELVKSSGGRPPRLLEFKGKDKFLVATEISEGSLSYGIFNLDFELIEKRSFSTQGFIIEEIIEQYLARIKRVLEKHNIRWNQLIGLGISVPGIYEEEQDRLINSTCKLWEEGNLKKEFKKRFQLPIYIENDANLAAYFEWAYGAGKNCSNLIYIYIADGIGGGLIMNNQLYKGVHGKAGEIGHIKVEAKGKRCECGGVGCLETVSSLMAIKEQINGRIEAGAASILRNDGPPPYEGEEIIKAYRQGDPLSREVINRSVDYLINAISGVVNIYDPGLVILGDMHDFIDSEMIERIRAGLKQICFSSIMDKLQIVKKTGDADFQMRTIAAYVFDIWKKDI